MSEAPPATQAGANPDYEAITFELDGQPALFGWLHPAPEGTQRNCGVVLCNPFAYDALSTHRSYRVLAETLAAAGYATLRFDYHGTGDSADGDAEAARMTAWIASIHAAIDTCRRLTGASQVALFGLSLGATLALTAAATRTDVAALMLWAPIVSGRKFVRQVRMMQAMGAPRAADQAKAGGTLASMPFEGLEAAGFRHTAETVADLGAIDLLKLPAPMVPTILLGRDDVPVDAALAQHWLEAGAPLETSTMPGYAAMMRDAQDAMVPEVAIGRLVGWLERTWPERGVPSPPPLSSPTEILSRVAGMESRVRERPVSFGKEHKLWGVVSQPLQPNPQLADTAVIFINAGGNHRIGPSRLTVPIARDLAALGCTALRIDLAGLGDSVPVLEKLPIFNVESVADVEQAIDFLSGFAQRNGSMPLRRFVLFGLCSGGFVAMHTAIQDHRVGSQIIMNLPAFEARPDNNAERVAERYIKPFRFYAESVLKPKTWRRAFNGRIDLQRIVSGSAARLLQRLQVRWHALLVTLRLRRDTSVAAEFRTLCRRGVQTLLVLSANDGAVDEMQTHLGAQASKMRGEPNFRYEIFEGADHTFTSETSRNALLVTLRGHIKALPPQP